MKLISQHRPTPAMNISNTRKSCTSLVYVLYVCVCVCVVCVPNTFVVFYTLLSRVIDAVLYLNEPS